MSGDKNINIKQPRRENMITGIGKRFMKINKDNAPLNKERSHSNILITIGEN